LDRSRGSSSPVQIVDNKPAGHGLAGRDAVKNCKISVVIPMETPFKGALASGGIGSSLLFAPKVSVVAILAVLLAYLVTLAVADRPGVIDVLTVLRGEKPPKRRKGRRGKKPPKRRKGRGG
jgi:hypothetical protein